MGRDDALEFLRTEQPLPPDARLSAEVIGKYDQARRHFLSKPDPVCVPLFLGSFGEGNGLGVYPLVIDTIIKHGPEVVVPELIKALDSNSGGVAYWAAQTAAVLPDSRLVPALERLVGRGTRDERYAAITALEQIDDPGGSSSAALQRHRSAEADEELASLVDEVLEARGE